MVKAWVKELKKLLIEIEYISVLKEKLENIILQKLKKLKGL